MKNKILQEFLGSNIKIKSLEKLEHYIDFCIENNRQKRISGKLSYHHILPQATSLPFKSFANLKENSWNGTYLLYSDHYYAHWLLTEAIEDYSQLTAFCAMHNKDIKLGRIEEKDLIPKEEFQKKMEEKQISINIMMNLKKGKEPSKKEKSIAKLKETLSIIGEDGLTIPQRRVYKHLNTKLFSIDKEGLNSFERTTIKMKKTRNKIGLDGLNSFQRGGLKTSLTLNEVQELGLTKAQEKGMRGSKNPSAKKIFIYNEKDIIMFKCFGNFKKICEDNDLPNKALVMSYRNNNKIFKGPKTRPGKYISYIGWYAIAS